MHLAVYFLLVLFGFGIVHGYDSDSCQAAWNKLEQSLRNSNIPFKCTMVDGCYSLNCSDIAQTSGMYSRIQLFPCETPPSMQFELNVPRFHINNFNKRIYNNDSVTLLNYMKIDFEVERKEKKLELGLFIHFQNNSPLIHTSNRYPLVNRVEFPADCTSLKATTVQPMNLTKSISPPPTRSFLVVTKGIDGYSNCSIINSTCGENEICKQINKLKPDGICVCISNYTRDGYGRCIDSHPDSSVSLLLTAILVPIFVILVIVAAVYASIRFKVFQHLRRRMRVQVYEHVLLGEDEDDDTENPIA